MKKFGPLLFLLALFFTAEISFAQVGQLDTTFGNGGRVFGTNVRAFDIITQPDGKILAAGRTATNSVSVGDYVVERYNIDGSVDTTFGTNGNSAVGTFSADHLFSMDLQPDGKIVLGGIKNQYFSTIEYAWLTTRLNSDGTPDFSFYNIATDFGANYDHYQYKVFVQPDGKILSCGNSQGPINQRIILTRRNSDHSYDTTFADNGTKTLEFYPNTSGSTLNEIYDFVLQTDGKIVCSGYGNPMGTGSSSLVFRLNTDGSNDSTFCAGNFYQRLPSTAGGMMAYRIALTASGGFIVGGETLTGVAFCRLNANASIDYTFGVNGLASYNFDSLSTNAKFYDMYQQPDGKILYCGMVTNAMIGKPYVARLNINGAQDTVFATNGYSLYNTSTAAISDFQAITMQADGKILATGFTQDSAGAYPTFYTVRIVNDLIINNVSDSKISSNEILIYPNPGKDEARVTMNFIFTKVNAIGIDGRVSSVEFNYDKLDISSLSSGFYILEFTDKTGMKIVKKYIKRE
jgi:uncharacterized delta-60 repeat protein